MKKISLIFSVLAVIAMMFSCGDGADTQKAEKGNGAKKDNLSGFEVQGDKVIFTFDESLYAGQLLDDIESVTVAGDFQGWDPTAADWHATKGEGGLWTFEAPLSTCPCGSKFKFVVNDIDWMQPDAEKTEKKYLTDDGFGGFNLQMACE